MVEKGKIHSLEQCNEVWIALGWECAYHSFNEELAEIGYLHKKRRNRVM